MIINIETETTQPTVTKLIHDTGGQHNYVPLPLATPSAARAHSEWASTSTGTTTPTFQPPMLAPVWENQTRISPVSHRTNPGQLNITALSQRVKTPVPTLATAHQLANTYSTVNEIAPWSRVQEYRRVTDYTAHHPNQGSSAVASALNLPRSRIRAWVDDDDGMPDPARGIDTARKQGWLDINSDSTDGRPWVQLVAWVFSGGSISRNTHQPLFFVREDTQRRLSRNELDVLRTALEEIGVGHQFVDRDDTGRTDQATHIHPAEHGVLVGRLLAAMGAPVGEKNTETPIHLPDWLWQSTQKTQRTFCRIYLLNRASVRNREPRFVFREQRPDSYHDDVAKLFRIASGHDDGVSWSGHNTRLRSEVVDALLTDTRSNQ